MLVIILDYRKLKEFIQYLNYLSIFTHTETNSWGRFHRSKPAETDSVSRTRFVVFRHISTNLDVNFSPKSPLLTESALSPTKKTDV